MGVWGDSNIIPKTLCAINTDGTVTVGNEAVVLSNTTGSDINTLISSAATDIDNPDPGDWYDLVDLSGRYQVNLVGNNACGIQVDSGEDADDALRCQVLIDDTIVYDVKAVKDVSDTSVYLADPFTSGQYTLEMRCRSSFKIRYAREGAFANADSTVYATTVRYRELI